ncbi:MAG: YqgE/AlgH family protein [Aeromicrobium sp.]
MTLLRGRLLVATPMIGGGPFWRSVVYVLDHGDDGSLGVIVNRPLNAEVADVLPSWGDIVTAPTQLFDGGPVGSDAALAVGVVQDGLVPQGWHQMSNRVGLVDLDGPVPGSGQFVAIRVFAGYAGWGAGQLDDEIDEGSWFVVDAEDSDLGSSRPDSLWSDVLRRQAGELRLLATFPADPDVN